MSNWYNNTNNTNNTPFSTGKNNTLFTTGNNKSTFGSNTTFEIKKKNYNNMDISNENNDLKSINVKLTEIKKEIDILKYKESTKHIIHQGIVCNNCQKNNICGMRFKCFTCQNYNICEDCERYLSYIHDNSHFFLRIHDTSLYNTLCQQQQNKV
jgi:hypothetical protein